MDPTLSPMLCATVDTVPDDPSWIIEPKLDGWRLVAHRASDGVHLYGGRNGNEYTGQLPYLEASLEALPADTVLDGELVGSGWGDVQSVMTRSQPHVPARGIAALTYVTFDITRDAGTDLRKSPWRDRRMFLEESVIGFDHVVISACTASSVAAHEAILELGLEGSVIKLVDSPYVNGRSSQWAKCKPQQTAEAKVVGFKPGERGGRFADMVGAFEVQMLDTQAHTTVKCGTDKTHQDATDNPDRWLDTIIEIKHHGIGTSGVPRHPQFLRRREDRTTSTTMRTLDGVSGRMQTVTPPAPAPAPAFKAPKKGSARMRNYKAMKDAKLLNCHHQLYIHAGDAYDRALNDQNYTVDEHYAAATAVVTERGLDHL